MIVDVVVSSISSRHSLDKKNLQKDAVLEYFAQIDSRFGTRQIKLHVVSEIFCVGAYTYATYGELFIINISFDVYLASSGVFQ